jgi:hypothetical protein
MHACREREIFGLLLQRISIAVASRAAISPFVLAPVAWPGAPRFTSGHPGTGYMSTPGVWTAGRTDEPVQPAVRGWSSSLVGLSLPSVDFMM